MKAIIKPAPACLAALLVSLTCTPKQHSPKKQKNMYFEPHQCPFCHTVQWPSNTTDNCQNCTLPVMPHQEQQQPDAERQARHTYMFIEPCTAIINPQLAKEFADKMAEAFTKHNERCVFIPLKHQ